MHGTRRALLALAAGGFALPAIARRAGAQGAEPWRPDRPVRLLTGFAAGGTTDLVARLVAPEMARVLGQNVVVENRTGASGNLATQAVVAAPADGLTIATAGLQLATNPPLIAQPGYDPWRDLQMVGQLNAMPVVVMAGAASGIRDLAGLIGRSRREEVTIGTAGVGTSSHLGAELLFRQTGGRFTPVQFRGGAPAFQALLSGDVQAMFDLAGGYQAPAAAEGRIRILAVMQQSRAPGLPDVPAFGELDLPEAAQMRSWLGIFTRTGTPPAAPHALHAATRAALASPAVQARFRDLSMEPVASESPEAFDAFYRQELTRWTALISAAGIQAS